MLMIHRQPGDDRPIWEPRPVLQTALVGGNSSESWGNDDEELSSMSDKEVTPRSDKKTPSARNIARLMCLATPTWRGEASLQDQRKVAKARMITGPVVYDEAPAWYYAIPRARATVGWQLRIKHRLSGRGFSYDDVNSIEIGKSISKAELLRSNSECNTKASSSSTRAQSSPSGKGKDTIKPSYEKILFLDTVWCVGVRKILVKPYHPSKIRGSTMSGLQQLAGWKWES